MLPYTVREAKVTDLDVGNGTLHTFATFDGEKVVKITEFHGLRKTREGFEKGAIHAFRLDAIERR